MKQHLLTKTQFWGFAAIIIMSLVGGDVSAQQPDRVIIQRGFGELLTRPVRPPRPPAPDPAIVDKAEAEAEGPVNAAVQAANQAAIQAKRAATEAAQLRKEMENERNLLADERRKLEAERKRLENERMKTK